MWRHFPNPKLVCGLVVLAPLLSAGLTTQQQGEQGMPPRQPILRIEAGGHIGGIFDVKADPKAVIAKLDK